MSESFPVRQASDRVKKSAIVLVATVGVLVTVFASAIPAWMLERRSLFWLDAPARASDTKVAPREINIIDQTLFGSRDQLDAPRSRARQRAALESYGLIDRERGLAHIPIERAMALIVERHARATSAAATSQPEEAP